MDELLCWRKEFPILNSTVYLAETWATRGVRAWEEGWWEMPVRIGDLVGKIIGAGPGEVVMQPNVSICQSIVLSCFDWTVKRNKIVTDDLNFPSNLYVCQGAERLGARLVRVPSADGITVPLERMLAAIDEETQLVSVSHVIFRSSYLQDLAAIACRAHEVGVKVVADIYHSAGTVPLNVRELGVDFATGGSVKWLCGGPGAGYLYARRELWPELKPRITGWMAHQVPFAFDPAGMDYADDAFRFLNGTPAIPALYAARAGYEIILDAGVERIRAKSVHQTTRLIELAQEAGFRVRTPLNPLERGGTVVIDVPHGVEMTKELSRRHFLVDYRPGAGIRVAPHFYSQDEEPELVIGEIRKLQLRRTQDDLKGL
jgi:kynureninase